MVVDAIDGVIHAPAALSQKAGATREVTILADREVNKNGICNCVWCRIDGRALYGDHSAMPERCGVAINFRHRVAHGYDCGS